MLTIEQAVAAVRDALRPVESVWMSLSLAMGRVLAEDLVSPVDSPAFDKSLMDGFAVRAADIEAGQKRLRIVEEVTAGRVPTRTVAAGEATRIMTGAPIPSGADAVVPVEQTSFAAFQGAALPSGDAASEPAEVIIEAERVAAGQHILKKGVSLQAGTCVLPRGTKLQPQQIGIAAELGFYEVPVLRPLQVAILATGDELVPVDAVPGPGQIRNSNELMLCAQVSRWGHQIVPLGIARDNRADLVAKISQGLRCDVLVLSGGVSAGILDLVPSVLTELGVRQIFHRVQLKPGQPLWFGSSDRCCVFGLPGNPVSSMVCCELFVRTAVRQLGGELPAEPQPHRARLLRSFTHRGTRPTLHPARLREVDGQLVAETVRWHGSADLSATGSANGMVHFPAGDVTYNEGEVFDAYWW